MPRKRDRQPSIIASITPLLALTAMLSVVTILFGTDAMGGANQMALLSATAVAVGVAMILYKRSWGEMEEAMLDNIRTSGSAIVILLLIGALSGVWMVSGVVPTMICYGLEVLNPKIFLVSASIICAIVSLMTGSSWTTIATIGVALMGIGTAQGFSEGWTAGAIISGAYFGDKLSMLSDTTIMASSTVGVRIFDHIRYMLITTIPAFCIALTVFLVAGYVMTHGDDISTEHYAETLRESFVISPWLLIVPMATMMLIARRIPAMITLTISIAMAVMALLISQPQVLAEIAGVPLSQLNAAEITRAAIMSCYGETSIATSMPDVTELVATRGMSGMMNTIWLVTCAMCFGGVMTGSGMLQRITIIFSKYVSRTVNVVASTLFGGVLFNLCAADQYISIILTGRLFKGLYEERGLEPRLLSRSVEDAASITSVLVPWNSCGMAQSSVLGVATWTYLPYCIFNLVSPFVSLFVAMIGYKIVRKDK